MLETFLRNTVDDPMTLFDRLGTMWKTSQRECELYEFRLGDYFAPFLFSSGRNNNNNDPQVFFFIDDGEPLFHKGDCQ